MFLPGWQILDRWFHNLFSIMFVCPNLVITWPGTIPCRFHCPLQTKNCSSTNSLIIVAQIVRMKEGDIVFLLKPPQSPHLYRFPSKTTTTTSIAILPLPKPHFHCYPSTSTATIRFLLLFHHHHHHLISIVFRPPPTHFLFPPSLWGGGVGDTIEM